MKATLEGGVLEGQQYSVPDDTSEIRLAKDVNNLPLGAWVYTRVNDTDIFRTTGSTSTGIEAPLVAIPSS